MILPKLLFEMFGVCLTASCSRIFNMLKGATDLELTVRVNMDGVLLSRQAAAIAERMKGFKASVLLHRENMTVNCKSLMGLLSVGIQDGMNVTIMAEGEDDAKAALEMARLLGA